MQTKIKRPKLGRGTSLPYLIIYVMLSGGFISWQQYRIHNLKENISQYIGANNCESHMIQIRKNTYKYTRPLMLTDVYCESDEFRNIKTDIEKMINANLKSQNITSASVYIRKLNNGSWVGINQTEEYNIGNMIKIPLLMTYMNDAEQNSAILDKEIFYNNRNFTTRELLKNMMTEKDNEITNVLYENMNKVTFKNLFTDIGLAVPNITSKKFQFSSHDFSKFLRLLYSATYVNADNSEYILSLMQHNSFKEGMLRQISTDFKVSHQEGKSENGSIKQLHESGIIYMNNEPILITIMTEGKDAKQLAGFIGSVSKYVCDKTYLPQTNL